MVRIDGVTEGSPAARKRIAAGDQLVRINGREIEDVLDYRFFLPDTRLKLELLTASGRRRKVTLHKEEYEEPGLEFETYLMDREHTCRNGCIFCFIDQMPPGMRPSLYVKDDDSRLSFLFGNYITLTNLSEHEIQRIIDMHISPINVSVHTTNPELRCRMMKNRFAGESLAVLRRFADAGLTINAQLVLCPGYNDGEELTRTMTDLSYYVPALQSVAAVPVGLTKYREGLTPLRSFTKEEAADVIDRMEACAGMMQEAYGMRLFYPSDEFYLLAGREIPAPEQYGEFAQLENGVGMVSLLRQQFREALEETEDVPAGTPLTLATGTLAAPILQELVEAAKARFPQVDCEVAAIRNDFFGEKITVAGLVTGQDMIAQLRGRCRKHLLIPACMLRREGDRFLDDVTPAEVEAALDTTLHVVGEEGADLWEALCL